MQYFRTVSDHYPVYVDVDIGKNGGTKRPRGKCTMSLRSRAPKVRLY